jgi:outer membrane lipoprotein-sorting protein
MIPHGKQAQALISLALLLVASCRAQNGTPATNNSAADTLISATPPYQTREPERYRAIRSITSTTSDGRTTVSRYAIAKDGEFRRLEAEFVSERLIFVQGPEGKFVLVPGEKVYMDHAAAVSVQPDEDESSPERLLHTESGSTSYKKLGPEVVSGRKTNKYLVVVNASNAANVSSSETLIWIDEALGMPIRSETKSSDGSRSTMELSELALEVDKNLFEVPADYKKVPFTEISRYLTPR